ncbi:17273_t:CDS:10, partial [Acaulospora colombiana]
MVVALVQKVVLSNQRFDFIHGKCTDKPISRNSENLSDSDKSSQSTPRTPTSPLSPSYGFFSTRPQSPRGAKRSWSLPVNNDICPRCTKPVFAAEATEMEKFTVAPVTLKSLVPRIGFSFQAYQVIGQLHERKNYLRTKDRLERVNEISVAKIDRESLKQRQALWSIIEKESVSDEETRTKALRVIDAQFDLEILLRHRELQKIEEELKKAELTLGTLKHCILEPPTCTNKASIRETTTPKDLDSTSKSPSTRHSTRKIYSTRDNDYFYYDPCKAFSIIVDSHIKLSSPTMKKPFSIAELQWYNDYNIKTSCKIKNYHKTAITPNYIGAIKPDGQSCKPKIKVFEEEIDVELEELPHIGAKKDSSVDLTNSRSFNNKEAITQTKNLSSTLSHSKSPENQMNKTIGIIEDNSLSPILTKKSLLRNDPSSNVSDTQRETNDSEDMRSTQFNSPMDIDTYDMVTEEPRDELSNRTAIDMGASCSRENDNAIFKSDDRLPNFESSAFTMKIPKETNINTEVTTISAVHTIPARSSVFDPIDHGSRFYVKRRIVVGNVSKWIAPEKRDPSLQKYTHKWMVYITGPPYDLDISPFIQRVRFFLHPSYRPVDVVDVTEPPFQLIRYGWGEFPMRIQLVFVDKKNRPVDIIHVLKLDETHNGKQQLGNERAFDLELDRNTHFISPRPENQSRHRVAKIKNNPQRGLSDVNHSSIDSGTENSIHKEQDDFDTDNLKILESLLIEAVQEMFLNWDSELRKKTELHRARLIRLRVLLLAQKTNDLKIIQAAASITATQSWHETSVSNSTKNVAVPLPPYKCKRRPHFLETKKTKLRSLTIARDFLDELMTQDKVDQGEGMMNVKDAGINNSLNLQFDDILNIDSNKDTKEFGNWYKTDISDPQGIDWIWNVINQLKLSGVAATKLMCNSDGEILVENGDVDAAITQRLETGNLIFQ